MISSVYYLPCANRGFHGILWQKFHDTNMGDQQTNNGDMLEIDINHYKSRMVCVVVDPKWLFGSIRVWFFLRL